MRIFSFIAASFAESRLGLELTSSNQQLRSESRMMSMPKISKQCLRLNLSIPLSALLKTVATIERICSWMVAGSAASLQFFRMYSSVNRSYEKRLEGDHIAWLVLAVIVAVLLHRVVREVHKAVVVLQRELLRTQPYEVLSLVSAVYGKMYRSSLWLTKTSTRMSNLRPWYSSGASRYFCTTKLNDLCTAVLRESRVRVVRVVDDFGLRLHLKLLVHFLLHLLHFL